MAFTVSAVPGFYIWYKYLARIYTRFQYMSSTEFNFHSDDGNPLQEEIFEKLDPKDRIDESRPSIGVQKPFGRVADYNSTGTESKFSDNNQSLDALKQNRTDALGFRSYTDMPARNNPMVESDSRTLSVNNINPRNSIIYDRSSMNARESMMHRESMQNDALKYGVKKKNLQSSENVRNSSSRNNSTERGLLPFLSRVLLRKDDDKGNDKS